MRGVKLEGKNMAAYHKCAERAKEELGHYGNDDFSYRADLHSAHYDVGLDFEKLLEFDGFNFAHDIYGISKHLNRLTLKLENCFLPRCSDPKLREEVA